MIDSLSSHLGDVANAFNNQSERQSGLRRRLERRLPQESSDNPNPNLFQKRRRATDPPKIQRGPQQQPPVRLLVRGKDFTKIRGNHLSSARNRIGGVHVSVGGSSNQAGNSRVHRTSRATATSSQPQSAIDILRKLLQSRWNPTAKLLDLANLAQDKILKAGGIAAPGVKGAPLKTASAIWKLCQEMYPDIQSLSLADNNLRSLQPMSMSSLVATLPKLANLSLAGNQLESFTLLNSLSPVIGGLGENYTPKQGLTQLRELILTGNPVRIQAEKEGSTALQQYLIEACRRFPSLQVLDGEVIDPVVRASLPPINLGPSLPSLSNPASHHPNNLNCGPFVNTEPPMPLSIQPAFFGDQSTSSFVAAFCLQYFTAFDQNRDSLIDVYATKSTFSLCASTALPARAKKAGLTRNRPEMPAQQAAHWGDYINMSRNNARLRGSKIHERLGNGPAEIVQRIKTIPGTKHPLSDVAGQHKFIVDAWQMPGLVTDCASVGGAVIYVSIHGEFQESPSLTVRSFDRTFILGAAGPASAAALKGWPCVILTDQLTVRSYSSPSAWSPDSVLTATAINPTAPELTPDQQNLANQLSQATKLNKQYTIECLAQNGWDLPKALMNFQEINAAGVLPPDAFMSAP